MVRGVELAFRSMQPEDLEPCVDLYGPIFRDAPWREDLKHSTARRRVAEVLGAPRCFNLRSTGWRNGMFIAFSRCCIPGIPGSNFSIGRDFVFLDIMWS
jgi:hypothetical protein